MKELEIPHITESKCNKNYIDTIKACIREL